MFLVASWWLGKKIWILPIVTNIWIIASVLLSYILSEVLGHETAEFPYISYTGTVEPESGIFSLTIAVASILLAANFEMRYLFVANLFERFQVTTKRWDILNKAGLVMGMLSAFGLLLVACFQVDTMKPPHYFGAFLCFVLAVVDIWVQVILTYKINTLIQPRDMPCISGRTIFFLQIINAVISTVLVFVFSISKAVYKFEKRIEGRGTKYDKLRGVFLMSTISEWLLTFSVITYLLTFIPCFKMLKPISIVSELNIKKRGTMGVDVAMVTMETERSRTMEETTNGDAII